MNDRFAQDAADALAGYEERAARRARLVQRWRQLQRSGRFPAPRLSTATLTTWTPPPLTESQRQELEQQIADGLLPF